MSTVHPQKEYPTLGCCGLDCGLCPRYYTEGSSRCPGCCGPEFFSHHPSCGIITCCVTRHHVEVCSQCTSFPCERVQGLLQQPIYDSFLTYKKVASNLHAIRDHGLDVVIDQQQRRMNLLKQMLKEFNDGRSKNYYCLSATLLSILGLEEALTTARQMVASKKILPQDNKAKAVLLKEQLDRLAKKEEITLQLNKPPHGKK